MDAHHETVIGLIAQQSDSPHDADWSELDAQLPDRSPAALLALDADVERVVAALASYRQHLARQLVEAWRPTRVGDDVVIVTYPRPTRKIIDEDTFWSFVESIILRDLSKDPEVDVEEAVGIATRTIGRLFNPSGIRIGAFKQAVSATGIDGEAAVDSLYSHPEADTSKPPKVGRVPISRWSYGYRQQTADGYEWVQEREENA